MTTASISPMLFGLDEKEYKRRIRAWTMYDWANSAFVTTVYAAVLPIYYSRVAGSTLPSEAVATAYWSLGLAAALFIIAILSPILGTISDIMRGKKPFLAVSAGIGIVATALLVLVESGDWVLASVLAIVGRIGFNASIVFYDALLPHVAKPEDQDMVSARGYAMGYLGGGLLLVANVVMIQFLPGTWGARLSFVSVAVWWAVFSIPLFRRIPEPPTAAGEIIPGQSVVIASFKHLGRRIRDIRDYRELFKYLIAFLIYNDGIGTIIGVATIYGTELGFGTLELILALLLVQFVGIPYSLVFGRLPSRDEKRRPFYLAFILFSLLALPAVGVLGRLYLPNAISGTRPPDYESTQTHAGTGRYPAGESDFAFAFDGGWETVTIPSEDLQVGGIAGFFAGEFGDPAEDTVYFYSPEPTAAYSFPFNGQQVEVAYSAGPDRGIWRVLLDGDPLIDEDSGDPLTIDAYNPVVRYGETAAFSAEEPGEHMLRVENTGEANPESSGGLITLAQAEVLRPIRQNNLLAILGLIVGVVAVSALFGLAFGRALFSRLAEKLDTRGSIILALLVYSAIAVWGFFLDSTIEFWFLAWMVAIVQGGSQALSRSLYASMSPAAKSGEFFALFGVMEKFSSILGPLMFAAAGLFFGDSRPAILSLIVLFIIGIFLLSLVNIEEGRRVAQAEDQAAQSIGGV